MELGTLTERLTEAWNDALPAGHSFFVTTSPCVAFKMTLLALRPGGIILAHLPTKRYMYCTTDGLGSRKLSIELVGSNVKASTVGGHEFTVHVDEGMTYQDLQHALFCEVQLATSPADRGRAAGGAFRLQTPGWITHAWI